MTDAPPKKRAWFQLHLSTCVVLMVVAGVLVWANVTNRVNAPYEKVGDGGGYGWPYCCYLSWYQYEHPQTREIFLAAEGEDRPVWEIGHRECAANLGVALAILALTALVCEAYSYIRGRLRPAKDPVP